jgi:hypothetical protein
MIDICSAENMMCMCERKNAYKILVRDLSESELLQDRTADEKIR